MMKVRPHILAAIKFMGLTAIYVIIGRLGRRVDFLSEDLRVFWPQAGVGLAGLILFGTAYWPAITLGSILNSLLTLQPVSLSMFLACIRDDTDVSFWKCLTQSLFTQDAASHALAPYIAVGNTLTAVVATTCLQRFSRFDLAFSRLHDVYSFCLYGVLLAPCISAAFAVYRFTQVQPDIPISVGVLFLQRWFGFAISNLVLAPVILIWSRPLAGRWPIKRFVELGALLLALLVLAWVAFSRSSFVGQFNYPVSYAPFPLVLWAALRFGPRGGSTATLGISVLAIFGSSQGAGPFLRDTSKAEALVLLQIYLMVLALTALLVGAASLERLRAISELQRSQNELRLLAEKLERVREEEQAHLAREIHDDLGQILTTVKMGVRRLSKALADTHPQLLQQSEAIAELVNCAVASVRRVATELRPGILDDLGLSEAMQWLAQEFTKQTGIQVEFEPPAAMARPPQTVEIAFFRILQEALTNVARHAQATQVLVRFWEADGWYTLEVRDNGVGYANCEFNRGGGLGIIGMRERALSIGGTFEILNGQELDGFRGTLVRVRAPVDRDIRTSDTERSSC